MSESQVEAVTEILCRYALEEDPDEDGVIEHRFGSVLIDSSRGSAMGYIANYISKNIDGYCL